MTDQVLQALARALSPHLGSGFKASGTPNNQAYLYEAGGLFGRCDGPSQLINAMVGPIGVESVLDWIPNSTQYEFVDTLKAIEESGSEQSTSCGDCKKISLKACAQFYCFGRFCRQTDELQFDRLGVKANSNVPVKALFGSLTDAMGGTILAQGDLISDAFFLQSRAMGYALRLRNSTMIWNGDPINSNPPAYQEYKGLQNIVNTGKYDAYTELECESIDSFLMNYGYNSVTATGTYAIQNWFRRMVLQFMRRAEGAGFDWNTANMYIVMTPNMWDCVAKTYACSGVDLCGTLSGALQVSADQARDRYEEYLSNLALPIYGRQFPVVLDAQIPETTGQANGICSDIYFLTTEINGESVLYGEYQDFNETYGSIRQEMVSMFGSDDIAITDNGRYAIVRDNSRGCFDIQGYVKPRIVARTPWLLGRIQNACCSVLQEPLPDTTGSGRVYEKDGGRTVTSLPTLYGDCLDC